MNCSLCGKLLPILIMKSDSADYIWYQAVRRYISEDSNHSSSAMRVSNFTAHFDWHKLRSATGRKNMRSTYVIWAWRTQRYEPRGLWMFHRRACSWRTWWRCWRTHRTRTQVLQTRWTWCAVVAETSQCWNWWRRLQTGDSTGPTRCWRNSVRRFVSPCPDLKLAATAVSWDADSRSKIEKSPSPLIKTESLLPN